IGTLGGPVVTIPVISTSFAVGQELADQSGVEVHVKTDTTSETRSTSNVIAETKSGRSDRVVVVGAHLDSVLEGFGINDIGSVRSGNVEVAIQMASLNVNPRNKVRLI